LSLRTKINQAPKTTAPLIKTHQARAVVLRRAKRFLPIGKNTYYCVSSLMPPLGGIVISEFFFFGSFFLFASRQKEKMNNIKEVHNIH
jgi:hypothetical protein